MKAQMKNQQFVNNPRKVIAPPPKQEPARPGSFKDRQNKKKEEAARNPPKQVESLADRRKGRKQYLGDDD